MDTLLNFIQENAAWAPFIIFLIAFLESVAVIGVLVPGWALLVGVGALIGADVISFQPIVIAAYLGAVIGEWGSFLLGRNYQAQILSTKWFQSHKIWVERSTRFFDRYGIYGVFLGRFFGPTRAVIPLVAGIAKMNSQQFFWVNVISGLFWAPLYLVPGMLVGAAVTIESEVVAVLGLFIIAIAGFGVAAIRCLIKAFAQPNIDKTKLLNAFLSMSVALTVSIILVRSSYLETLNQVLILVWSKIIA
ncbi:DedA family protein [Aliikangiella sp. IMCC44632]